MTIVRLGADVGSSLAARQFFFMYFPLTHSISFFFLYVFWCRYWLCGLKGTVWDGDLATVLDWWGLSTTGLWIVSCERYKACHDVSFFKLAEWFNSYHLTIVWLGTDVVGSSPAARQFFFMYFPLTHSVSSYICIYIYIYTHWSILFYLILFYIFYFILFYFAFSPI